MSRDHDAPPPCPHLGVATVPTQRLLPLPLVGMFEDEEVVSGAIRGDPVGELMGLRRLGVNKLNGLFLYVQPLQGHVQKTCAAQGSGQARPI